MYRSNRLMHSWLIEDLNMQFPDGDIRDYASFKKWYDRVTNLFFDENHYVQTVEAEDQRR